MSKPKPGPNYHQRKAARHRAFARAKWLWTMLIYSLGGRCALCSETELSILSIDHLDGCSYRHRDLRYDARVARYLTEFAEGTARLRVLCIPCNSSFRPNRQPGDDEDTLERFDHDAPPLPDAPF